MCIRDHQLSSSSSGSLVGNQTERAGCHVLLVLGLEAFLFLLLWEANTSGTQDEGEDGVGWLAFFIRKVCSVPLRLQRLLVLGISAWALCSTGDRKVAKGEDTPVGVITGLLLVGEGLIS